MEALMDMLMEALMDILMEALMDILMETTADSSSFSDSSSSFIKNLALTLSTTASAKELALLSSLRRLDDPRTCALATARKRAMNASTVLRLIMVDVDLGSLKERRKRWECF
jgi:hypothetical protein